MIEEKAIIKPDYYVIKTPFQVGYDGSQPYIKMITKLVENQERNLLICSLITSLIDKDAGRSILILSPYVKHCETLSNILNKYNYKNSIITGNLHKDIRKEQIEQFKRKETNILIATTIADEGLDIPHIDTLVLACPTKFEGRMLQRVGRILRPSKGKTTAEVYDFYEHTEGLFIGQFNTRSKTMLEYFGIDKFKALDYSVSGV
jgi:superfamily II DNA or RNA helicase